MFSPIIPLDNLLQDPIGEFDFDDLDIAELENSSTRGQESSHDDDQWTMDDPTCSNTDNKKNHHNHDGQQELREWDVLLGRAQHIRSYIGNVKFRQLIEQYRPEYNQHERKAEKSFIATQIYHMIRAHGGRFLDKRQPQNSHDPLHNGEWCEISIEKALSKISQSLRKGTRPTRKEVLLNQRRKQQLAAEQKRKDSAGQESSTTVPVEFITIPTVRPFGILHSREVTDGSQQQQQEKYVSREKSHPALTRRREDSLVELWNHHDATLLASMCSFDADAVFDS